MKQFLVLAGCAIFLYACGSSSAGERDVVHKMIDTAAAQTPSTDTLGDEYELFYILIADTGKNYFQLHEKMLLLSKQMQLPVDTMDRFYNQQKDLIALPDNHDDEMYAGDYFPRRFPGQSLSIEYLPVYLPDAGEKTMALVAGIFEEEHDANAALNQLKQKVPGAFKTRAEIYVGCMH